MRDPMAVHVIILGNFLDVLYKTTVRELKQRRRRRRRRRPVKNEFIFYKRNSRLFRSSRYANGSKNLL